MTQEEKQQILLRDLCSRLPYEVKVWRQGRNYVVSCIGIKQQSVYLKADFESIRGWWTDIKEIKPYLRPMSSMTEEEKKELKNVTCPNGTGYFNEQYLVCPVNHYGEQISFDFMSNIIDWLNAHHFDMRNLIGRGLAIDCTNLNIY